MRKLFRQICAPKERGSYLEQLIDKFAERFCRCNPTLGLEKGNLAFRTDHIKQLVWGYIGITRSVHPSVGQSIYLSKSLLSATPP